MYLESIFGTQCELYCWSNVLVRRQVWVIPLQQHCKHDARLLHCERLADAAPWAAAKREVREGVVIS